jgi:uncharacterized membrane protein YgdD (TMEM256/DUF423 family)
MTQGKTRPSRVLQVWSRAVHYQQIHSLAMVLTPLVTLPSSAHRLAAGGLFGIGITLFSGGCYAYGEGDCLHSPP